MPTLRQFRLLSDRYLRGAKELLVAKQYSTAYYLAGYSVECLLKAAICKRVRAREFPPRDVARTHYVHKFETLLKTARLDQVLDFDRSHDPVLDRSYLVLKDWEPDDARYEPAPTPRAKARDFIDEIERPGGFASWLKKHS